MRVRTVQEYLQFYERGMFTRGAIAGHLIGAFNRENLESEMAILPEDVLTEVRRQVLRYRPGQMILIGFDTEPTKAQLAMLRDWFARHPEAAKQPAAATA